MIIGVIGGVGAGKSSVLDVLTQEYQFTAYRTDDIAKSFYVHGHPVFEALKALLGADIERADGSVEVVQFRNGLPLQPNALRLGSPSFGARRRLGATCPRSALP